MIKKFISIFLLLFMICGCTDRISLNSLGYNNEDIELIRHYRYSDVKPFYLDYDQKLLDVIEDQRCNPDKIKEYVSYYKMFDLDTLFELVNNNLLKKNNINTIEKLYKQKYFIARNVNEYIKYLSRYDDIDYLISYVNVGAYKKPYVEYKDSITDDEMLILANKWNYLNKYEPSNLIKIDKKYGLAKYDQQLKKEAYDAFVEMYEAAKEDKINIYITSAYRDYDYQIQIHNQYLIKDPQEVVDTYSSRPGYSDHQTGLACDILSYGYDLDKFVESDACTWLLENADKFGFILRYPEGKEEITGYMYESWHYRYVGKDTAKYIKENNITYDEYYAYFIENNTTNNNK